MLTKKNKIKICKNCKLQTPIATAKSRIVNNFIQIKKKKEFQPRDSPEPILPIRRIRKLRRAPETPGGPLALKDFLILVSFLSLASGYENMNDHFLVRRRASCYALRRAVRAAKLRYRERIESHFQLNDS